MLLYGLDNVPQTQLMSITGDESAVQVVSWFTSETQRESVGLMLNTQAGGTGSDQDMVVAPLAWIGVSPLCI